LPSGQKIKHVYKGQNQYPDCDRHVCLPNPHYVKRDEAVTTGPSRAELALPKDMLQIHNRIGGQLPTAGDSAGWLFTGRELLMRDLIRAAGSPEVAIVTGRAGSGKSTLLSRFVTLSDPRFCRDYADELGHVPAELLPRHGGVDVAVSARERSNLEVLEQLCFAPEEDLPWLPIVREVTHLWDWNRPARNAAAMEMRAALTGMRPPEPVGGPWRVHWAIRPTDTSIGVLLKHDGPVWTLAVTELSGIPVAVVGGAHGTLQIWDLSTGALYRGREPIDKHGGALRSLAVTPLPDGRTVAVTGNRDGAVRVWNQRSGLADGDALPGSSREVTAVTVATLTFPERRVVVAAADHLGTIRTWDLATRQPGPFRGIP